MNRTQVLTLVIAVTICLLATAGCTSTSGTAQPAGTAAQQHPAVSFNATPVRYATVNGVTLG